ncbi:MAG: Nif3-like dinuclear metal center hexameric protein [Clostridia bacterium]|nr:Nif3-like dinuclear metal center hexameric protein [Clostridia bacterium]
MPYKIKDVITEMETFAPLELQADFDNSGLILGDPDKTLTGVLITLDTNISVVNEAIEKGCNLIIEHHPSIFEPLRSIDYRLPLHRALALAIKNDIVIYAAHTNADFVKGGLNDYVAEKLGLKNVEYLYGRVDSARVGNLAKAMTMGEYARFVGETLKDDNIVTIGDENMLVRRAAVINGSGGGSKQLLIDLQNNNADIFLTADIKYSFARFAKDLNYGIICFGHYDSELGFVDLVEKLLKSKGLDIKIVKTKKCLNPYNIRRENGAGQNN